MRWKSKERRGKEKGMRGEGQGSTRFLTTGSSCSQNTHSFYFDNRNTFSFCHVPDSTDAFLEYNVWIGRNLCSSDCSAQGAGSDSAA